MFIRHIYLQENWLDVKSELMSKDYTYLYLLACAHVFVSKENQMESVLLQ